MFMLQKIEKRIKLLKQMTEIWTRHSLHHLGQQAQWRSQEGPLFGGPPRPHFPDY
jgi:hypothetical protein